MRRFILGTAALATTLVLVATPALAAEPVGYGLTWGGESLVQLAPGEAPVEIESTTAPVAVPGLDVDENGRGYAVTFMDEAELWSIDISGEAALVGPLLDSVASAPVEKCTGLDYSGGVLSAACDLANGQSYVFGTIDTDTAVFTVVQVLSKRVAAIARNPIDGIMYGFTYQREVLAIVGGTDTQVATTNSDIFGADFASDGTLWTIGDNPSTAVGPWNAVGFEMRGYGVGGSDFAENFSVFGEVPVVTPPVVDEDPAPQPMLADTGVDSGAALAGGFAAATALLAGLVLMLVARRARRQD